MQNYAESAIQAVIQGETAFCKFLAANDTGKTGAHQYGIYIAKSAFSVLFDTPGVIGENKDRWERITWNDDFETDNRFVFYGSFGRKTKSEYRITNFGDGFPFFGVEYTGALFILVRGYEGCYKGYVLNSEDEIDQFLNAFGMTPAETNRLISGHTVRPEAHETVEIDQYIASLEEAFPSSEELSAAARRIQDAVFDHKELIISNPDQKLLEWTDLEFRLFKALEYSRYSDLISRPFDTVDEFVATANQVLNRRKSRAGKSLEHHLAAIFAGNSLQFQEQAITEGRKKPDFLFPSQEAYHNRDYPVEQLISLAAKTTCKDRWRQVINEADRLRGRPKYLCTLQQGISTAQLDEMQKEQVILVVPRPFIAKYPKERQDRIWTLEQFVRFAREVEGL